MEQGIKRNSSFDSKLKKNKYQERKMKKIITAILIATMITSTTFAPKNANALIAAGIANPALGMVGLYIFLGGIAAIPVGAVGGAIGGGVCDIYSKVKKNKYCTGSKKFEDSGTAQGFLGGAVVGLVIAWAGQVGLVVLDEKTQKVNFGDIDEKTANKYGITPGELESFNNENDQLSLVFNEISTELGSGEHNANDSSELWQKYKGLFSEKTQSALQKMFGVEETNQVALVNTAETLNDPAVSNSALNSNKSLSDNTITETNPEDRGTTATIIH